MNPVGPLKSKTAAVLAFIQEFIAANRYPPTIREITEGCDLSSTSVATYQLDILEHRGLIIRYRGKARGIRLTSEGG